MARNTKVPADHDAPPVTQLLARFVATHPTRGWNDGVEHEAHRTLLNWLGCAIGAAHHEAADATLAAIDALQPAPQATVLGRDKRVDMANAALVNGITSHVFDFDDTHLKTIIHPAGPVASALLALAEVHAASGRALIDALVLGIDVACRMGNAMSTPITTIAAGTSPARPACSARRRRVRGCSASTNGAPRWRSVSRRPSRPGCASSSAP